MISSRVERLVVRAVALLVTSGLTACGTGMSPKYGDCDLSGKSEVSSSDLLACYSDTDWDGAAADPVTITMTRVSGSYAFTADRELNFVAGQPYVMKLINDATALKSDGTSGKAEHYLSDWIANGGVWSEDSNKTIEDPTAVTEGGRSDGDLSNSNAQGARWADNGFWRSIVIQKLVTSEGTYKMPFLLDFELNTPASNDASDNTEALIYFVPVVSGSYKMYCNKGGHEQMQATLTITGDPGKSIDFELVDGFEYDELLNTSARHNNNYKNSDGTFVANPWRTTNGSSDNHTKTSVEIQDSGTPAFAAGLSMNSGTAYQYRLYKASGLTEAYTFGAEFLSKMVIRKIQDIDSQIKPVYMTEITLNSGAGAQTAVTSSAGARQVDLYIYPPTGSAGTYSLSLSSDTKAGTAGTLTIQ